MRKQTVLRLFFAGEVVVFTWFYFCSSNGVLAVNQLKQESSAIEKQILIVTQEIEKLQTTITAWQSNPFYKEQIAREKLHMAREEEIVYCM